MSDLVEFLRARLDEDEDVARAACHQKVAGPSHGVWLAESAFLMAHGMLEQADRRHIARHNPHRVLADVEAKRRIVDLDEMDGGADDGHAHALRCLALPYADHPDYDEAWRP